MVSIVEAAKYAINLTPGLRDVPYFGFWSRFYMRNNQRRQEHLATLNLPIAGRTVLETGAGIGDHTLFFVDRGCNVTVTEGRPKNLKILQSRFPELKVQLLDLNQTEGLEPIRNEIVYCYGTLYHLSKPKEAIEFLAASCQNMMLLETCVSVGDDLQLHPVSETASAPHQSISGTGCRPTRPWVYAQLKRHFPYVYMPLTQPYHEEFPLDWDRPGKPGKLTRAIFIASREQLTNPLLSEEIPVHQRRG